MTKHTENMTHKIKLNIILYTKLTSDMNRKFTTYKILKPSGKCSVLAKVCEMRLL